MWLPIWIEAVPALVDNSVIGETKDYVKQQFEVRFWKPLTYKHVVGSHHLSSFDYKCLSWKKNLEISN